MLASPHHVSGSSRLPQYSGTSGYRYQCGAVRREAALALVQLGNGYPEISFESLCKDRFVLTCHCDHPLANAEYMAWKDLAGRSFIRRCADSGTTSLLERTLGKKVRHRPGGVEVGHFHALLALAGENLGVLVIPALMQLKRADPALAARPVIDPIISRSLGIVASRGRVLSPAGRAV